MSLSENNKDCPREEIAAYLDGELDSNALISFEEHVAQCAGCAAELRSQRQLLCTLEAAFRNTRRQFQLPDNFTRVVAAHAENDMRGLRHKVERRRALQLCAALLLAAFMLLGAASNSLIFQPARAFLRLTASALDVFLRAVADGAEGVTIIARMVARTSVTGPHGFGILIALVFLIAISLLPRLIANYHRIEFIE
ncbi:MAG TPA: zf-HC2 domain-containing protein [Pyrinomonadaceae bacterium]|nr:zf-HC2 domain-containing protein [Pyrinomonadaceae bacterium]